MESKCQMPCFEDLCLQSFSRSGTSQANHRCIIVEKPRDRFYEAPGYCQAIYNSATCPLVWKVAVRQGVVSHFLSGPWSTRNRNLSHHPAAGLGGIIILPKSVLFLRDCLIAMELAVPRNCFSHQACKSNLAFIEKNMPQTPKEPACGSPSEHGKGVRSFVGSFPIFGSGIQRHTKTVGCIRNDVGLP